MPYSSRCMLPVDWSRLTFFTAAEFKEPGLMGFEFLNWLESLRTAINIPLTLTSTYRSATYNTTVGGAPDSAHCDIPCNAVDIGERVRADDPNWNHSRWLIMTTAVKLGCTRMGLYANGSIHLDMTADRRPGERIWRVVGNV
jgi:uncharacterized protein YcbK (DUF882 family)